MKRMYTCLFIILFTPILSNYGCAFSPQPIPVKELISIQEPDLTIQWETHPTDLSYQTHACTLDLTGLTIINQGSEPADFQQPALVFLAISEDDSYDILNDTILAVFPFQESLPPGTSVSLSQTIPMDLFTAYNGVYHIFAGIDPSWEMYGIKKIFPLENNTANNIVRLPDPLTITGGMEPQERLKYTYLAVHPDPYVPLDLFMLLFREQAVTNEGVDNPVNQSIPQNEYDTFISQEEIQQRLINPVSSLLHDNWRAGFEKDAAYHASFFTNSNTHKTTHPWSSFSCFLLPPGIYYIRVGQSPFRSINSWGQYVIHLHGSQVNFQPASYTQAVEPPSILDEVMPTIRTLSMENGYDHEDPSQQYSTNYKVLLPSSNVIHWWRLVIGE